MKCVSVTQKPAFAKNACVTVSLPTIRYISSEILEIFTLDVKQWTYLEINIFTVTVIRTLLLHNEVYKREQNLPLVAPDSGITFSFLWGNSPN